MEPNDFNSFRLSIEKSGVEHPWSILEEITKQLIKIIILHQDREKEFQNQIVNIKKLLNQQNEDSIEIEQKLLETQVKLNALKSVESNLKKQYLINTEIQETLRATENSLAKLKHQKRFLEKEVVVLTEIKKEVIKQPTMLSLRQWKGYAQDAKNIWTQYSKIAKSKRTNYMAMKHRERLEDLIDDYTKEVGDPTSLTAEQSKLHKNFHEQIKKYKDKLLEELTKLGGIPEDYDHNRLEESAFEDDEVEDEKSKQIATLQATVATLVLQLSTQNQSKMASPQQMRHTRFEDQPGPSNQTNLFQRPLYHPVHERCSSNANDQPAQDEILKATTAKPKSQNGQNINQTTFLTYDSSDDESQTNQADQEHNQQRCPLEPNIIVNNTKHVPSQANTSHHRPNTSNIQQVYRENPPAQSMFYQQPAQQQNNNEQQVYQRQHNSTAQRNYTQQQEYAQQNNSQAETCGDRRHDNRVTNSTQSGIDMMALHDAYSKLISRGVPFFEGKGKRDEAYLELKRFIAAMELSWGTAAINRVRSEKLFTQIIITSKISGKAYDRVAHTNFETVAQLISVLKSEYDLRITVTELTEDLKNAEQYEDEDVTMFANRLRRMLNQMIHLLKTEFGTIATGSSIQEKRLIVSQRFKLGLREPELRQAMTASKDSDLEVMEAHCVGMEKLLKLKHNKHKPYSSSPAATRKFTKPEYFNRNSSERRSTERSTFKPPTDYNVGSEQKQCTHCSGKTHEVQDCWIKDRDDAVTCATCNNKGHRALNCKRSKVHFVEMEDELEFSEN